MASKRLLLSFQSPTCGPCHRLSQVLDTIGLSLRGIELQRVDVTQDQARTQRYHVTSVPTLIALREGEVIGQQVGFAGRAHVERFIETLCAEGSPSAV